MATQKQIDPNRRNAEGRAASRMNALKSGIHTNSQIIRGENPAEYFDRYHPTTPEERTLVDTLIDCEWLLRCFRTVEAQPWVASEPRLDASDVGKEPLSPATKIFPRLQRRIDSNYRRALQGLEQLRRRPKRNPTPSPNPARTKAQPHKWLRSGIYTPRLRKPAIPLEPSPSAP